MSRRGAAKEALPTLIRCAIYTRKSSDEGLDQEFNSLDAQRESAEEAGIEVGMDRLHLTGIVSEAG